MAVRLVFPIILLLCSFAGATDVINSTCRAECGNVTIKYPFGIGAGCYLDDWFEIVCDENSSDPSTARPYLRRLIPNARKPLEVLEIQIEDSSPYSRGSTVRVNFPILRTCGTSYNESASKRLHSLEGSPFLFDDINNSFVAMGCDNLALMTSVDERVIYGGCTTDPINCTNSSTSTNSSSCNHSDNCYCDLNAIPSGLVRFTTTIRPAKPEENSGGCKFAFLVDRLWFSQNNFTTSNPLLQPSYVPVVLEWGINPTLRESLYASAGSTLARDREFSCYRRSSSTNYTYRNTFYSCYCVSGYEGNPFLPGGCQDIDECEDPKGGRNPCGSKRCKNTRGDYRCLRPLVVDIIIVKKSKLIDEGKLQEFINEVVILSQINHRNIVKLLGCCLETEVPLLVYEFIPNGTLSQYLNGENEEFPVTWDMRLRIATEVARALFYLHSAASSPIFHRDIKSTNILLDDKYRAKIADFGTSRSIAIEQTHLTTIVYGTLGYLDPEYFQSSQFTEKSDVYSFGVVLAELLTGEKAISSSRTLQDKSLATYFIHSMEENNLFDILDKRVLKEAEKQEIIAVANLANRCLNLNGKKRPKMKEVSVELEGIQMLRKAPNDQQNNEVTEDDRIEMHEQWDVLSTSSMSGADGGIALQPLLSFKSG
ncbi:Wall-associated receptor kinase-like 9 [Morella rubra]|uniref:Wall-associated receptor kinase-like 9 n=1 Tax=Morella rubra TaxID=262757 RepID=A0A6A1VHU8_9ROSI|nr:Wall-associated receptor kinase-like 9 [Morella rubra]